MMTNDFEKLDFRFFKAFTAAAKLLNFTAAAKEAAMTQSGVSQHVAALESQLGAPLFTRHNKKVRLTRTGELLLAFCTAEAGRITEFLEKVHNDRICGKVSYAMPHTCLFAPHFVRLLRNRRELADIELAVTLCPNETVFEKLLDNSIDFGFVSRHENNPAFRFEHFCREEYILVAGRGTQPRPVSQDSLAAVKLVDYPGMKVFFDMWARHHFGKRAPAFGSLRKGGCVNSIHGALDMIEHGAGVAVLPRHCVGERLADNSLLELKGPRKSPLANAIFIVTPANAAIPPKVQAVISLLKQTLH